MPQPAPQNFANHVRYLPAYHFVAFPLFFANFCYAAYQAVAHVGAATVMGLVLAVALVLLFLLSRMMVVTVQDRVIRLEERLRMRALLPADLQPAHRPVHREATGGAALRVGRRTAGACAQGPRRADRGPEGDQEDGHRVARRLPAGLRGNEPVSSIW